MVSEQREILYSRGEKALEAHIIPSGPVTVVFETDLALTIDGVDLIVGTFEYFLSKGDDYNFTRIADVIAPIEPAPDSVPLLELPELLQEYELGLQANMVLAKLIQAGNLEIQSTQPYGPESKQLRLAAMVYFRFTELITTFALHSRIDALFRLTEENRSKRIYKLGAALYSASGKSSIIVPVDTSNRFIERFERNDVVCQQGDKDEKLFVLLSGKVSVTVDGVEVATITQPGEAFGELSLLLDGERTATMKTVEPSDFYVIPRADLMEFFKSHEKMFIHIGRTLMKRLMATVTQIELLKVKQPEQSLAKELEKSLGLLRAFAINLEYIQLKNTFKGLGDLCTSLNRSIKSLS